MPQFSERFQAQARQGALFLLWIVFAALVGLAVGAVGVAFHMGIAWAAGLRAGRPALVFLLPVGGVFVVTLYHICGMDQDRGTNLILLAVRDAEHIRLRTAPLIFLSTVATHLVGGSAGREGAALQLGGSLSFWMARRLRLDDKSLRVAVMCGMAAAFSALFGTPLTAAMFAMEVVTVGQMYYAALVPCLTSSLTALLLSRACGLHLGGGYAAGAVPPLTPLTLFLALVMGVLCALVSILFCVVMHRAPRWYAKYLPNPVLRAAVGGGLVLGLTLLVGNQNYNGAGDAVIRRLLAGETIPEAFLLKLLFTALTLGAGFRGGEIVPVLFTGCAFGTLAGPLLGLPHGFSGALGMAAVFCGCTNCPLTSLLLSYELFGGEGLPLYALCCAASYMLSGYYGLYSAQKIAYSKFHPEFVDRHAT